MVNIIYLRLATMKKSRPIRGRHRIEDLIAKSSVNAFAVEYDWGMVWGKEVF